MTHCPLCNTESFRRMSETPAFWRCPGCQLLFRSPMPTGQKLADYYQSGWEQPESRTEKTGGTNLELAQAYVRHLGRELGLRSFRGLRVLDYGAGRGALAAIR